MGDCEIQTRNWFVIKTLIPSNRTISSQKFKLLDEISEYNLYYSLTSKHPKMLHSLSFQSTTKKTKKTNSKDMDSVGEICRVVSTQHPLPNLVRVRVLLVLTKYIYRYVNFLIIVWCWLRVRKRSHGCISPSKQKAEVQHAVLMRCRRKLPGNFPSKHGYGLTFYYCKRETSPATSITVHKISFPTTRKGLFWKRTRLWYMVCIGLFWL